MNSSRPYILRALHEWIVDNQCTPHLLVDINHPQVQVPPGYAADGRIVLNIASRATGNMHMDNDYISFSARFGGVSRDLWVPMQAVMGIYARENSQGLFFDPNEYDNYQPEESDKPKATDKKPKRENKAGLKVLK